MRFLTGVGIPEGILRGLLKIPPGLGDHGALGVPEVFVPMPGVSVFDPLVCAMIFRLEPEPEPETDGRVVLARELAVGASRREEDSLDDDMRDEEEPAPVEVDVGARAGIPVGGCFVPILPIPPAVDILLEEVIEVRVPIEETPFPVLEDNPVPTMELVRVGFMRLVLVVDEGPKEGRGDLEREDAVPAVFSFSTSSEAILAGGLVAVEGRALLTDDNFFCGGAGAGTVGTGIGALTAGFGIAVALSEAAAVLPPFQTFWTSDLAEDRNPNLEGFACGLTIAPPLPTLTRPLAPAPPTLLFLLALFNSSFLRIASFSFCLRSSSSALTFSSSSAVLVFTSSTIAEESTRRRLPST